MSFKNTIHIVGMKASKGTLDNGQSYDSTKVYALTNLNTSAGTSAGTSKGMSCSEYNFGTAAEFEKFKHLAFPFVADVEMDIVTNGKTQRTLLLEIVPRNAQAAKG